MLKFVTGAKEPPAEKSKKRLPKGVCAGLCARKWPDCIFLHLLIQSFWVPCELSSKNFSKKNLLFEAEIYMPGYAQNAGFCTIYPRASGGALSGPLTPGRKDHLAWRGGQTCFAGLIGQPNNFFGQPKF
jgi:hypothetical protein